MLTLEPLNNDELIFSLNNQPIELEKDYNSEKVNTSEIDFSISAMFNAVKMLSNYIVLINVSLKTNF